MTTLITVYVLITILSARWLFIRIRRKRKQRRQDNDFVRLTRKVDKRKKRASLCNGKK